MDKTSFMILGCGTILQNLFSLSPMFHTNKLECFVLVKHFNPSLIFLGDFLNLPSQKVTVRCFTLVGFDLKNSLKNVTVTNTLAYFTAVSVTMKNMDAIVTITKHFPLSLTVSVNRLEHLFPAKLFQPSLTLAGKYLTNS